MATPFVKKLSSIPRKPCCGSHGTVKPKRWARFGRASPGPTAWRNRFRRLAALGQRPHGGAHQALLPLPLGNIPPTPLFMAKIFLAIFLIVFGLNLLFGLLIPAWVTGILALIAGIGLAMECFGVRVDKKQP
jgi:hypothetical protein